MEFNITPNPVNTNHSDTTLRFQGASWFTEVRNKEVLLAGLGGIGSYVALQLSRLDISTLYLYDNDIVESVNISGQLHSLNNVGNTKVGSIIDTISNYSNFRRTRAGGSYVDNSITKDIMIGGFDNMSARKVLFNNWRRRVIATPEDERGRLLFIDGRLTAEDFQVLSIVGNEPWNIERYEKDWLFEEGEAEAQICSFKQTSFVAAMIGSIITNIFVNFVDSLGKEFHIREVPFLTTYNAVNMSLKTER